MVRRKMTKVNRFKQSLKTKQGKGILLIVAVAVLFLFGSTAFNAFDLSKVAVGVTAKTSTVVYDGDTVDEGVMVDDGLTLYFILYGYATDVQDPVGVTTHADTSDCVLVCTENNAVRGEGTAGMIVVVFHPMQGVTEYGITPYFAIDVSDVYKGTHSYKFELTGSVIGVSIAFDITGDASSPDYSDDDGGDDNGDDNGDDDIPIPELPEFVDTPADAVSMFANETETFVWKVADDNPSHYSLYLNGTLVQTGLVTTEVFSYPMTIANYTDGVYSFEFVYEDVDTNEISHTMVLTVTGGFGWEKWANDNPMMVMVLLIGGLVLFGGGGGTYVMHSRR